MRGGEGEDIIQGTLNSRYCLLHGISIMYMSTDSYEDITSQHNN